VSPRTRIEDGSNPFLSKMVKFPFHIMQSNALVEQQICDLVVLDRALLAGRLVTG
jgi:hypothetical protein